MRSLICFLVLAIPLPAMAQRNAKVPDPDPEKERKTFQVPKGFEVSLYAADPLLAKPIQMQFDPEGRLWIASSETYPHIKPGQKANDKILILEDTNEDGKADKTTVFADKLLIPTGLEPGDGGVYVANSTELIHLSDTNGDGKADRRRVVLSGFGTEDTHHLLHTLRWGPDGALYMNQSIYIHSHVETPHGVKRLNGGGIWRFRPPSYQLEIFARGWVNAWGHHFDRWGQSFVTDGAGGEGINFVVPGAGYPTAVGVKRILHGLNPGSPKYCGAEVVTGRHLPPDWRGNIITNDFRAHRVCRFVLKEDGSGFAAQQMPDVIKSTHPAFRPIDVKMGPDGAIYIADWYNPIIQHGEVDFRDPRRDHVHGRIWRITAKGRPLVKRPALRKLKTAELLEALKAPEGWTREKAKRVLQERGRKILPTLKKWLEGLDRKKAEHEELLLEGLWAYQSLGEIEPSLLGEVLRAKDGRIRAAGGRVISEWWKQLRNPLQLLAELVRDEHPRARLEAVRSLARIQKPESAQIALYVLDRPMDHFLDHALWLTLQDLQSEWLPAVRNGTLTFGGRVSHLTYALKAINAPGVVGPLTDLVRKGKVPPAQEAGVLSLIASQGSPRELSMIFDLLWKESTTTERKRILLQGLAEGARERKVKPLGDLTKIKAMLDDNETGLQAQATELVGLWGMASLRPRLIEMAKADKTSSSARQAALQALVSLGDKQSHTALKEMATKEKGLTRQMAFLAFARLDPRAAASLVPDLLKEPKAKVAEIVGTFLQQKQGVALLTGALKGQSLPVDAARVALRAVRASGRKPQALMDAISQAGKLTEAARKLSPQEIQSWSAEVLKQGDPARGEEVFRRAELNCLQCHAIAGAGGRVGPDLISIGASAPVDYLLESLLLPNKAIKENYHSLVINTTKGKVITGIKIREANKQLILRTVEDEEVQIPLKEIEDQQQGASLMPEGLTDALTKQELLDLTRFLSELGKVGPYQVGRERVARRWQALQSSPDALFQLRRKGFAAVARPSGWQVWQPHYSRVSGDLPLKGLPVLSARRPFVKDPIPLVFVQTEVEVTTPGRAELQLNDVTGVTFYLNEDPREARPKMALDLSPGRHRLLFQIRLDERKKPLRVELTDHPGSKAQVRFLTGK